MSAIFAVNNRRFDPLGDRPVPGIAPARPAYRHESQGVTYTLDPSASGGYLMTSTTDEAAVEVLDVDHAARLIDEIEGTAGEDYYARRAGDNLARGESERQMPAEQHHNIAKDTKPAERETAPTRPLHPATEERLGAEAAEGDAMAHRAGEAWAGQQDWLAADEVAMLHVTGQATPTPREVHDHSVRQRDAAGEGERGGRVPGRIGRWVVLAAATVVVADTLAYKRRMSMPTIGSYLTRIGDGKTTTFIVRHNLGAQCVIVQVYKESIRANGKPRKEKVDTAIELIGDDTCQITVTEPPAAQEFVVMVVG
ncbi:MAG: hypothetical protein M3Y58_09430 [Chloroflexota bacterium]|nr:hypothetical protein [Chloroflexota bacterium]